MERLSFNDPKYSRDEIDLQLIFPDDVWIQILKKLRDSGDYNCIDAASPYFHTLLRPLRTRILFPEVIKICMDSMLLNDELYFSLLKCRSACKTWKKGVELSFHQILSETITDGRNWRHFGCSFRSLTNDQVGVMLQHNTYDIYNPSKLDRFLEFFHNSHFVTGGNPFPTRAIEIEICSDLSIQKTFEILQIYGHHIWHCYVQIYFETPEEMQQGVLIFCKLMSLLTHLQTLTIFIEEDWDENTEYSIYNLTAHSMPKLKNLKLLTCHNKARPLVSDLIQKNPHIKGLRLSQLDFNNPSALLSTPLPNLEEFIIMGIKSAEHFSELQSVQVQWQLTKLTFCFDFYSEETLEINPVFNWIEAKWSETLKELNLYIPLSSFFSEINPLNLANLTTLRIEMGSYGCLDFLLPLSKSLVYLSVRHAARDEYNNYLEKDSRIQFFSRMKNLRMSNIWEFFPRLREIYYEDNALGLYPGRFYRRNHWTGHTLEGS